ncbi:MAG TPA: hypothetical protein PKE26_12180 [Kiritimatiellia bacterium]|nr:hypothetical protein [Kiritimatiellia bacterium]HMO99859.1 hypothetical protein [Kiritimatiellia bacterium]HMP96371.1 hypothetical protein [Kiritimatiellia bacterium]
MKRIVTLLAWLLLLALLVILWLGRDRLVVHGLPRETDADAEAAASPARLPPGPAPSDEGIITYHPMADAIGDPSTPPEREPELLYDLLQSYRRLAGNFPTAEDNAALMRVLRGNNPSRIRLFPDDHERYARDGALRDAWGTPFFFHHLSSQDLQIRSAGPDREFYTDDDITAP